MKLLLTLIAGGVLTFAMRFSMIYLSSRMTLSESMRRILRYVPAAVLSAIIAPELLLHTGRADFSPSNHYLITGLVAMVVARLSGNALLTILVGMGLLLALQLLF